MGMLDVPEELDSVNSYKYGGEMSKKNEDRMATTETKFTDIEYNKDLRTPQFEQVSDVKYISRCSSS